MISALKIRHIVAGVLLALLALPALAQAPPVAGRPPVIANGHVLGNATGANSAPVDTALVGAGTVSVGASGGTITITGSGGSGTPVTTRSTVLNTQADTMQSTDWGGAISWLGTTVGGATNQPRVETLLACDSGHNGQIVKIVDSGGRAALNAEILVVSQSPSTVAGFTNGTQVLLVGANQGSVQLTCDSTATPTNWMVTGSNNPAGMFSVAAATTVTRGQWFSGAVFVIPLGSNVTLTMPTSASLNPSAGWAGIGNGGITIQSMSSSTIAVQTGDSLVGFAGTPPVTQASLVNSTTALITLSSTSFLASTTTLPLHPFSWSSGMNLAACASPPCYIPLLRIGQNAGIGIIQCVVEVPAGGPATLDLVVAPIGTPLASGTIISSAPCNANGGAGTSTQIQVGTIPSPPFSGNGNVLPPTMLGVKATGWGTGAQNGSGMIQVSVQ